MPFQFERLSIPDVILITPRIFPDDRGFFLEAYKYSDFSAAGICDMFIQDNHSQSTHGVLRGLHYQLPPMAQAKLVRCIHGAIFDVAVDIRRHSPTFGQWAGCKLSPDTQAMLYIPAGFAHGFFTLTQTAEILYKTTADYSPGHERCIQWNDPAIGIEWGIDQPILSQKDQQGTLLEAAEVFD